MTLAEFLSWLSTPGGVTIAVGLLLYFALEYAPMLAKWQANAPRPIVPLLKFLCWIGRYSELSPKEKRLAYAALCLPIPLIGASLRAILGYVPWTVDPLYWQAITAGATAFGAGTLVHTAKLPSASERQLLNRLLAEKMAAKAGR